MLVDEFSAGLPQQYDDWNAPTCVPRDRLFSDSITGIWGMIVPNKMQVIRYACSLLDEGEIYLEAGVLQGMSMICATKDNHVRACGVDNWSQFPSTEGNANATRRALREAGVADRVSLIEDDIKHALLTLTLPPVGVYHYDANHDYFETLAGLELALPRLADEALILVDDAAWPSPRAAVDLVLSRYSAATPEHGQVEMLFDLRGDDYQGVWTTGMAVLRYRGCLRE